MAVIDNFKNAVQRIHVHGVTNRYLTPEIETDFDVNVACVMKPWLCNISKNTSKEYIGLAQYEDDDIIDVRIDKHYTLTPNKFDSIFDTTKIDRRGAIGIGNWDGLPIGRQSNILYKKSEVFSSVFDTQFDNKFTDILDTYGTMGYRYQSIFKPTYGDSDYFNFYPPFTSCILATSYCSRFGDVDGDDENILPVIIGNQGIVVSTPATSAENRFLYDNNIDGGILYLYENDAPGAYTAFNHGANPTSFFITMPFNIISLDVASVSLISCTLDYSKFDLILQEDSTGVYNFLFGNTVNNDTTQNFKLRSDSWHVVGFIYDSINEIAYVYLDNNLIYKSSISLSAIGNYIYSYVTTSSEVFVKIGDILMYDLRPSGTDIVPLWFTEHRHRKIMRTVCQKYKVII